MHNELTHFVDLRLIPSTFPWNQLLDSAFNEAHAVANDADIGETLLEDDCVEIAGFAVFDDITQLIDVDRVPTVLLKRETIVFADVDSMASSQLAIIQDSCDYRNKLVFSHVYSRNTEGRAFSVIV